MFLVPILVVAFATSVTARFTARAYGSTAVCRPEYSWTDNSKNVSPCFLAANVLGRCAGPNWNVPALKSETNGYNAPGENATDPDPCNCSWAAYNLLSVCAVCQGSDAGVRNWAIYKINCGDKLSDTYFPAEVELPSDIAIPAYAAIDPSTWSNQRFDPQEARAIHDRGLPDLVWKTPGKKSTTSAGPIIGGVIGGVAVLVLAGIIACFMYRKKQKRHASAAAIQAYVDGPGHSRNMSDVSQKSSSVGLAYQRIIRSFGTSPSSQPPMSPISGTMYTHSSNVNPLSYFGSVNHSVVSYSAVSPPPVARTLSPTPPPPNQYEGMSREEIIVPFTLNPSLAAASRQGSSTNLADRKRTDGAIIPVYDSPNSPPAQLPSGSSALLPELSGESSQPRRHENPPAYSEVDAASQRSRSRAPVHSKKGSADTQLSMDSNMSGTIRHGSTLGGGGSISAIDDVVGQMGFVQVQESVSGSGGTLGTGQSLQMPRSQVFRSVN